MPPLQRTTVAPVTTTNCPIKCIVLTTEIRLLSKSPVQQIAFPKLNNQEIDERTLNSEGDELNSQEIKEQSV